MEKYISKFIKEDEIKVEIKNAYVRDKRMFGVFIEHIPTGISFFMSNKSQVLAYNIALKELEAMLDMNRENKGIEY